MLEAKIAKLKVIARDALRMQLISPRLSKIAAHEADIKSLNEGIETHNHDIAVTEYELKKLEKYDKEHPDYELLKKDKDEWITAHKERIEAHKKEITEVENLIKEQKEGIAKIESGETKVSIEALNDLVAELIKNDALKADVTA